MANIKSKFNSSKSVSKRVKGCGKISKHKQSLTDINNVKTRSGMSGTKKSISGVADSLSLKQHSVDKKDKVLVTDTKFKRKIHIVKDNFLNKNGYLKKINKDNLQICNDILMRELLIQDNKEKPAGRPQNSATNNNDIIISDKNSQKISKISHSSKVHQSLKEIESSKINHSHEVHQPLKEVRKAKIVNCPKVKSSTQEKKKGNFTCDFCLKQFGTKPILRRHMYLHLNEEKYPCPHCKKAFRNQFYLKNHITRQHPDWETHYMCNLCDKPFLLRENLITHMASHTNPKAMSKCVYCNEKFLEQNDLIRHEKQHLVSGLYDCIICEQSFDCRNKLTNHFKTHLKVKDFICQYCGKNFLRMNSMRRHVRISHAGIRVQCAICKKYLKGHLSEHMRTHEQERPHKCPDCGQTFIQSTQLTVHRRSHSGARPYPCRICKRPFSHSNALMLHIRRHTGEKPFKCAMCPMSFSQLPHMKAHMRKIHGKDNPYRCKKCKKFFKLKVELENHAKVCKAEGKDVPPEKKTEEEVEEEKPVMSLSRMRFLLALLLTMIATKEKLKYLGFNKRLIDDLLVESLEAMDQTPCKDESLSPIQRLKTNIEILLTGTVPKEKMEKFRNENKQTEDILELLTNEN